MGLAFAAVNKGLGHDRVDARGIECGLHGIAVDGIADQALAEQRIGQRRQRRAAIEAAERVLQIVQREAIAADIDDAGRRTGDRQR